MAFEVRPFVKDDFYETQVFFQSAETSDILLRATAPAAFHNSDERFDPPKCHPKTRLAVLTKIMKWVRWEEDLDAFIMWVYGPAGAGKSAIAETIAEMCEEEMILLASFFFSRTDPSRSTVKPLVATIAYQITLNLPQTRDLILSAIQRDPLIFNKSLAVQVKSLIMTPLQSLPDSFNNATSRYLIIIDGLDECFDPKVQQNIVEVLANSQQEHQVALIFLISSRPEQHISFAFSTRVLPSVITRITLDDSYLPEKDIELFLIDKFQEIKSSHPRRAYIPPQWPHPDVLRQLITKSSGQFIYASTVIRYVTSIRHKPTDRLDIVLGIRPTPQRDLPFAELDALYTHVLAGVEDIEHVLEILSILLFSDNHSLILRWTSPMIEDFLSLQPGDVDLYLGDLNSLVNFAPDQSIRVLHTSLSDFFVDPTRSKTFWINRQARHAVFARRCLQVLQAKGEQDPVLSYFPSLLRKKANIDSLEIGYYHIVYHLENAEMTPELRDDLIAFSFDCVQDVLKQKYDYWIGDIRYFSPRFLECLKKLVCYDFCSCSPFIYNCMVQPLPEADHILHTFQANFDKMIFNALEKHHSSPGFALLLGSILEYTNLKQQFWSYPPGMVACFYLFHQQGEGHILDDMGFSGIDSTIGARIGTRQFLTYFIELLENPERSGTHAFNQQRYTTAAKECLQLCLCSHRKFSKGATESAGRDKVLLRNKPWAWKTRLGIHTRIRKSMRYLAVQWWRSLKAGRRHIYQNASFPENSSEHEYYRSLAYQWALDLLPLLLEKSSISLELADVLHCCRFTTMAWEFPQRMKLAKEAIANYLLRLDPAVDNP